MSSFEIRNPNDIRVDGGTQFRVALDEAVVKDYADKLKDGAKFPPVVAFQDADGALWLGDGFHRHAAAISIGALQIGVDIRPGTRRDAILFSLSANANHGLRRTNDDIRKAVAFCLRDPELRQLGQREIADLCGCTQGGVSKIKNSLFPGTKQAKGKKKAAETQADAPADNGYQPLDTPEQIVAAISSEERPKILNELITRKAKFYGPDKLITRMERLGLLTIYGEDNYHLGIEWTPLADGTLEQLLMGEDWLTFEATLYRAAQAAGQQTYRLEFGQVQRLLEKLAQAQRWMSVDDFGYEHRSWLEVLSLSGCVREHVVMMSANDWDKRRFYHIDADGCQKLGLDDCPDIGDAPTKEALKTADKEQQHLQRQARAQEEAAREAKINPQTEAERERTSLLGWGLTNIRQSVNGCHYLNVVDVQVALDAYEQAVRTAALKPSKAKKAAS